jgi:hypothetical protein
LLTVAFLLKLSHDNRFMWYSPRTGKILMSNYYSFETRRFSYQAKATVTSYQYKSYVVDHIRWLSTSR